MTPIKNILVPVDFTPGAAAALRYALALRRGERAIAAEARVTVMHALDLESVQAVGGEGIALRDKLRWREALDAFVKEVAGGAEERIDAEVLGRDARAGIPEAAARHDLVVIGARSKPERGDLTPGGVAEAVVRRSTVPVIVVKKPDGAPEGPPRPGFPPREIVFATDLTPFSRSALRFAMSVAFAYDVPITALHVVPDARALRDTGRLPVPLAEEIDRFYETELHWQRDELGRFLRDRLMLERPIAIREVVRAGDPATEIAAECRGRGADLLVVATHGGGGIKKLFLGSVAEKALRLAPCSVLTVRPTET